MLSHVNVDHETIKNHTDDVDEANENQIDIDDVEVDELESDDVEEEFDTYGMDSVIKHLLYAFHTQLLLIDRLEVCYSFCL